MAYAISEKNLERQRLLAHIMEPVTDRLLDHLQLPPNSRCLDIGCGIGETTRQLAAKLGSGGEVCGIDQDASLIQVAQSTDSATACTTTFDQGEAANLRFRNHTFDFVLARYLLHHLHNPEAVLAEMLRVCKSGGVVAVQEPDCAKQYVYPESWAYEKIPYVYSRLFANAFIGRRLYSLFRQLGCASPYVRVDTIAGTQVELRRSYRMIIEAISPAVIEKGILHPADLAALTEELKRVENQDDVLCVWSPTFSVWVVHP